MKTSDLLLLGGLAVAGIAAYLFTRKSGTASPVASTGSQTRLNPFFGSNAKTTPSTGNANPVSGGSTASPWAAIATSGITAVGNALPSILNLFKGSPAAATAPPGATTTETLPVFPDNTYLAANPASYGMSWDPVSGGFSGWDAAGPPAWNPDYSQWTPDFSVN